MIKGNPVGFYDYYKGERRNMEEPQTRKNEPRSAGTERKSMPRALLTRMRTFLAITTLQFRISNPLVACICFSSEAKN